MPERAGRRSAGPGGSRGSDYRQSSIAEIQASLYERMSIEELFRCEAVAGIFNYCLRPVLPQVASGAWPGADLLALLEIWRRLNGIDETQWCEEVDLSRNTAATVLDLEPSSRWTVKQVAEHVGLAVRSVQHYAEAMGGVKIGKYWYFDPEVVKRWQRESWWQGRRRTTKRQRNGSQ